MTWLLKAPLSYFEPLGRKNRVWLKVNLFLQKGPSESEVPFV